MMGSIYDGTGKLDLALKNYDQALKIRRDIGDKQGTANVLSDLGDFYVERGKYDEALPLFKQSLQAEIEVHNDTMQGQVVNNIGNTYLAKGDFDNARIYFTQALQVREKLESSIGYRRHIAQPGGNFHAHRAIRSGPGSIPEGAGYSPYRGRQARRRD